ncbi:MAG: hypothetical protein ACI35O_13595 [Bacillaceae bacterium]
MLIAKLKLSSVFLLLFTMLVTGCSTHAAEFKDGDAHVSKEMNEVISNYIVKHYADLYPPTEKNIEVHKIYGTSEIKDRINVYMYSEFGSFNKSTGLESQGGHALPAVIQLKKESAGYTVVGYKEPKDGADFSPSLKKMFPNKYLKIVQKDIGNAADLQKAMDSKVKNWLEAKS